MTNWPMNELWKAALERVLEQGGGAARYICAGARLESVSDDGHCVVDVPDGKKAVTMRGVYRSKLERVLEDLLGAPVTVEVRHAGRAAPA